MDIVFLREFKVDTIIGVYEWERKAPQTIQLDIEVGLPDTRSCQTDQIEHTIDYGEIVKRIQQDLSQSQFTLIEALSEHIAKIILEEFGAPWTRVSVTKIGLLRGVKRLGVVIERGQRLP